MKTDKSAWWLVGALETHVEALEFAADGKDAGDMEFLAALGELQDRIEEIRWKYRRRGCEDE